MIQETPDYYAQFLTYYALSSVQKGTHYVKYYAHNYYNYAIVLIKPGACRLQAGARLIS